MPVSFKKVYFQSVFLIIITFLVYAFSNQGKDSPYNYMVLLSDAFLHGRLYLLDNPSWLNELVEYHGHFYVVYPPGPAIILMPFVAFFGTSFSQSALSVAIGSLNAGLAFLVIYVFFKKVSLAWWGSILFAFGTMHWYHTVVGSVWYFAHTLAIFFVWLTLLEVGTKRNFFLIGFFIGCSYLSRLPAILSIIFVLLFLHSELIDFKKYRVHINFKNCLLLGLGLLPAILFNAFYNYFRFGVFNDIAYTLLPVFHEPWYKYGLFNIRYIPVHLKEIFTAMPIFSNKSPYIIPSQYVMALWFITPAFFLIPFANYKQKLPVVLLVTIIIASIPSLTHGENGFTQFGFRFALDYLPFLVMLTVCGLRGRVNWISILLLILSIIVNWWGVYMILFLNQVGW